MIARYFQKCSRYQYCIMSVLIKVMEAIGYMNINYGLTVPCCMKFGSFSRLSGYFLMVLKCQDRILIFISLIFWKCRAVSYVHIYMYIEFHPLTIPMRTLKGLSRGSWNTFQHSLSWIMATHLTGKWRQFSADCLGFKPWIRHLFLLV